MIPQLIFGALTLVSIGIDWYYSEQLWSAASQLEKLLEGIEYGMSFETFITECWLFVILAFAWILIMAAIAFPKPKRVRL